MKRIFLNLFRNARGDQNLKLHIGFVGRYSSSTSDKEDKEIFTEKPKTLFKQTCSNLLNVPKTCVIEWLDTIDTIISDCDGVLWINQDAIEGSVEAFNRFKEIGKKTYFCTNNSGNTRSEIVEKAHKMGYQVTEDYVMTAAHSTAKYLKKICFEKKAYVIGRAGLASELNSIDIKHVGVGPDIIPNNMETHLAEYFAVEKDIGAVIVGFDYHFNVTKIIKASSHLMDPECLFIATNMDESAPMKNFNIPGTGALVHAIQTCAERTPYVTGKPNSEICEKLLKCKEIIPERTLIIGDRCNTDILLGYNCGFQTLLVGTGVHTLDHVERWRSSNNPELHKLIPDTYLPKFGDILQFIKP